MRSSNKYVIISNLRRTEGSVVTSADHSFIFLADRPDPRMRFTLAHEFCHYLIDIPRNENIGWFDNNVMSTTDYEHRISERFANAFAAALLLPATGVARTLDKFREIYNPNSQYISDVEVSFLSRFFGVSFQVAGRRLEDLQLIEKGGAASLYHEVISQYGSPEKFANSISLPPRPKHAWGLGQQAVLQQAKSAVMEGKISVGRLAEILDMSSAAASKAMAQL